MAKNDDGPRERNKPSDGFSAKWFKDRSREEEEVSDWINSVDGQIVLGVLGIIVLIALAWNVVLGPIFGAIFG